MADTTIHCDIVSAEGEIFSGPAKMVFVPAAQGEIGIAPRHAPLLTMIKSGEVRVQTPDGQEQFFFVGGGALEIQPKKITVLADTAVRAKDMDEAAAIEAKQRAEEVLKGNIDKIEPDRGMLQVSVDIFGRSTPVELQFWQVERDDRD